MGSQKDAWICDTLTVWPTSTIIALAIHHSDFDGEVWRGCRSMAPHPPGSVWRATRRAWKAAIAPKGQYALAQHGKEV